MSQTQYFPKLIDEISWNLSPQIWFPLIFFVSIVIHLRSHSYIEIDVRILFNGDVKKMVFDSHKIYTIDKFYILYIDRLRWTMILTEIKIANSKPTHPIRFEIRQPKFKFTSKWETEKRTERPPFTYKFSLELNFTDVDIYPFLYMKIYIMLVHRTTGQIVQLKRIRASTLTIYIVHWSHAHIM